MLALMLLACRGQDPAAALEGPAQVYTDGLGVAHIYAATDDDAVLLQGYVTARDRLFQMDLLRRRAHGRRAEVLGEALATSDLQSRALGFCRWGQRTAQALPTEDPEMFTLLQAYAAGVNRYLEDAAEGLHGASLPPQFAALGYEPEPWTVVDTLAIEKLLSAGLSMRPDQDLVLGLARLLLGERTFADFYRFHPFDRSYITPGFWELGAGGPPAPGGGAVRVRERLGGLARGELVAALRAAAGLRLNLGGSNNMAVAGWASASGHALLAGDSHQGVEHPSAYYLVHLNSADAGGTLDVAGATFPGVPLVLFGHNGQIAWAPTTAIYDAADTYLELVDGDEVRFEGEDLPLVQHEEELRVRLPDGSVEVRPFTLSEVPHHGPLLPAEALGLPLPLNLSIRWTGYQARSLLRTFYGLNTAQDFEGLRAALDGYFAGGMHWLMADVGGNIGYSSHTHLPLREQLDPDSPPVVLLPGDGGYEWLPGDGGEPFARLDREHLPWAYNPEAGWLASGNNDPVGQTDDNNPWNDAHYLSGIFDIGTRHFQPGRLLEQAIGAGGVDLDTLARVQLDTHSRPAERLLPFLLEAAERRPDLVDARLDEALEILAAWDHRCPTDAAAPTLFHAWLAVFAREVLEDEADGRIGELLLAELEYQLGLVTLKMVTELLEATAADIDAIEAGELPFPSASGLNYFDRQDTPELETRDALLLESLALALEELEPLLLAQGATPDLSTWTWGRYHTLELLDAAHEALPEASSARRPKDGGFYTVNVGDATWLEDGALPAQLDVVNAPSNRFLFELDPAGVVARVILPGGQSERPGDAHHLDQLDRYLAGETAELPYARAAVEQSAEQTWALEAGWPGW